MSYIPKLSDNNFSARSIGYVCLNKSGNPGDSSIGTELIQYNDFVGKLFKQEDISMMQMHAALGVCGEAGELGDAIKKHVIYGKELDRKNIVEELGDLRFFMQAIQNIYNITEQEVLQHNGYKLIKRYNGLNYSNEAAIARPDKLESGKEEA